MYYLAAHNVVSMDEMELVEMVEHFDLVLQVDLAQHNYKLYWNNCVLKLILPIVFVLCYIEWKLDQLDLLQRYHFSNDLA